LKHKLKFFKKIAVMENDEKSFFLARDKKGKKYREIGNLSFYGWFKIL
jgi:hypothetical protein